MLLLIELADMIIRKLKNSNTESILKFKSPMSEDAELIAGSGLDIDLDKLLNDPQTIEMLIKYTGFNVYKSGG